MPNPFYDGGFPSFPNMNNLKGIYQAMSQSQNPYQMFMNLAGNNPQLQPIVRAMQSGGNPQQIFTSMCQQRGINPNDFIKQLQDNNT